MGLFSDVFDFLKYVFWPSRPSADSLKPSSIDDETLLWSQRAREESLSHTDSDDTSFPWEDHNGY